MPELPEVETVRRGLAPAMEGHVIARAEVNRPDLRWPLPERMAERLTGARIERLRRPLFHHDHPLPQKHDHIVFHMDQGARVTFNDARRFGAMDLVRTDREAAHWLLAGLGPEPFGNAFNEEYLIGRLKGRATPIKAALLDQRILAGLGNIYVCEVLHRAGVDPRRQAGRLSAARIATLVPIIREVLSEAIEAGGSSLRDHRQADGELGYFQHTFRAYDLEGEACSTEGCGGEIRRIVQSGRSTFFCPQCQR